MRTEIVSNEWGRIYDAAQQVAGIEPWYDFGDEDLIILQPKGYKEPLFLCIMGKEERYGGIGIYIGYEGLADYYTVKETFKKENLASFSIFDQNSISIYYGSREGKPHFYSYKSGYYPYIPDAKEGKIIFDVLENLYLCILQFRNGGKIVDFEADECLCYKYSSKEGKNIMCAEKIPVVQKDYPSYIVEDELFRKRLKKSSRINNEVIIDLMYYTVPATDDGYERPVNPLLFIAIDLNKRSAWEMEFFKPDTDRINVIGKRFAEYIRQFGRMCNVYATNPFVLAAIEDICECCSIQIIHDDAKMELIREIVEDMKTIM